MSPQIAGVLRIVITSILAGAVAKGVLSQDQAGAIAELAIGTLGIAAMAAWSWITNSIPSLIRHVAGSSEVQEINMTTQKAADAIPNDKVAGPHMGGAQA